MNFPEEFREFLTGAGVGRARKKLLKKHRKKFQSARREKKGGEKQAPGRSRLRDLELPLSSNKYCAKKCRCSSSGSNRIGFPDC